MKRGEIVIAAIPGDYGKPRPYIVVQSDLLAHIESILLCPLTSDIQGTSFRLAIPADQDTGLLTMSEAMTEKLQTVRRDRVGKKIGKLDNRTLSELEGRLAIVLGLRG